jgi:hypothetical protein
MAQLLQKFLRILANIYQKQRKGHRAAAGFAVIQVYVRPVIHGELLGHLGLCQAMGNPASHQADMEMLFQYAAIDFSHFLSPILSKVDRILAGEAAGNHEVYLRKAENDHSSFYRKQFCRFDIFSCVSPKHATVYVPLRKKVTGLFTKPSPSGKIDGDYGNLCGREGAYFDF